MRKIVFMSVVIVGGALLNVALNRLILQAGILPLYLDTVFTVAVTLSCGLAGGIITGALTNLIGHTLNFWGWEGYLFAFCNGAAALVTFLFVRFFPRELDLVPRREAECPAEAMAFPVRSRFFGTVLDRTIVLILLSFVLCLVMSFLGGLIAAAIGYAKHGSVESKHASSILMPAIIGLNLPGIVTEILLRIPVNIVDRLLSVFAGFGAAKLFVSLRGFFRARVVEE